MVDVTPNSDPLGGRFQMGEVGVGRKTHQTEPKIPARWAGPLKDINFSYSPSKWHYESVTRLITPIYQWSENPTDISGTGELLVKT